MGESGCREVPVEAAEMPRDASQCLKDEGSDRQIRILVDFPKIELRLFVLPKCIQEVHIGYRTDNTALYMTLLRSHDNELHSKYDLLTETWSLCLQA